MISVFHGFAPSVVRGPPVTAVIPSSRRGSGSLSRLLFSLTTMLGFYYILLWAPLYAALVGADTDPLLIDCYRWDGGVTANNTKCPNSNACCGPTATCLSNRLCHNVGDGPDLFVRGPCAVKGWDPDCAQICQYDELGGVFPRVTICADGSLCCNNDPQCCQDGKGVFLDEAGNIASARATAATTSYPPLGGGPSRYTLTPSASTTTTTTAPSGVGGGGGGSSSSSNSNNNNNNPSSISASSFTSEPAGTAAATASSAPSTATRTTATDQPPSGALGSFSTPGSISEDDGGGGGGNTTGFKIGLGLGIPLSVLVTACVVYYLAARRHRSHFVSSSSSGVGGGGGDSPASYYQHPSSLPPQQPQYPGSAPHSPGPGPGPGPAYYVYSGTAKGMGTGTAGQQPAVAVVPVEAQGQSAAELDAVGAGPNGAREERYYNHGVEMARGWYAPGGPGGVVKS
ncbi:uncharacterized protein P884DRAFT_299859 [Thermothelomyces heterothallicus CBS 202.75]|uniref:uncharacterized protein n=1 Tax=Thermothelomyces heterothallicus CBS 202.75 TaxID=1149848 RepID=UPI003742673E